MRSGDHVHHRPSGETWVVAWADHESGYMAPCGWPTCEALISDCELVKVASDDECAEIIDRVQRSGRTDAHKPEIIRARALTKQ